MDEGYIHLKVNHSINFKDPETGTHTNAIESSWRHAKGTMGSGTRKKAMFPPHLAKYMFMKMCRYQKMDPCETFYRMAGELYSPLKSKVEMSDEEQSTEIDETDENFA
ncbi:uncharacterized protein LOC117609779 [Osmia lignaria lignaria]|uniref:uncharacterized protein LOC117609779 n=1 Tax=Osmia lignaria lignaria TaxID=1437193 RepID=UPI00147959DF|nr:uncharacterized protein LOC117609779 [Osmia lignaria]